MQERIKIGTKVRNRNSNKNNSSNDSNENNIGKMKTTSKPKSKKKNKKNSGILHQRVIQRILQTTNIGIDRKDGFEKCHLIFIRIYKRRCRNGKYSSIDRHSDFYSGDSKCSLSETEDIDVI